jgi:integrase
MSAPFKKFLRTEEENMIYKEWLFEWLENYVKPTVKQRTYDRYYEAVALHILPSVGDFDMEKLTPVVLQKFVSQMLKFGNLKTGGALSANTVNGLISVVKYSLKCAYELKLTPYYAADNVKRPKVKEKKITCFSLREQQKLEQFLVECKRPKFVGILLSLYTGLRLGEVLALEWSDIDLKKGLLQVNKTCYFGAENGKIKRIITAPKSEASCRTIPLPKGILNILRELKRGAKSKIVVTNNSGMPIENRAYQRSFELILKKLKLPHRGYHSLRHTFATRAIECGVDVKTLSELLGHKNAAVTLNRYTHSLMEHKRQMMNKVGRCLNNVVGE